MLYQRVLITGANGLLGQELVAQMSRVPKYDVLATGRDPAPRFTSASCGYLPLDVSDPEAVQRVFLDFTPGVVINCAAMTHVDGCEDDRDTCWKINAVAVEHLARQCHARSARLVQVSTDFVFDGEKGPYRETARPRPLNYYGKAKLAGENAAREAGIDKWAIARTNVVYGTGEALPGSNFVLWVIDKLSKGEPVNIFTDQWRTPTYAFDLAAGIERIVRFGKTGVFNLSGRDFVSMYDFARAIARVFDFDASIIHPTDSATFKQKAKRPLRTGFIILKAETELGFKPRSLDEALRHLGTRLGLPVTMS